MKDIVILCIAFFALATSPDANGYEIIYPYGYVDSMMRSAYESSQTLPASSRLLFAPLGNFFFKGCPTTVIGGQVIGNTCFTVTTTPTAFAAAQTACNANGGTLAQPIPLAVASQNFYKALKGKFPLQFATVEAAGANPGRFWIGYRELVAGGPFLAQDLAGNSVLSDNLIFPITGVNAVIEAAAIFNPGTTWQEFDPLAAASLLPFICQYTLVV